MAETERDEVSGTETTGHEWDGIKELNTPLPRWWLWTFYATIIWAVGYMIAYPAIPLIDGATKGLLGWSSRAELTETVAEAKQQQAVYLDRIAESSLEDIRADPELLQFAVAGGRSAFAVNCSTCHASGAQGSPGYPNLNDDDWLWGGTLDDIYTTLVSGVRFEQNPDTRLSEMPAFGADELLEKSEIADVANYVASLSGKENDAAATERGAAIYEASCAACHLSDGSGEQALGAPALNDAIWLYGDGSVRTIAAQVTNPRHGIMPAWGDKLDDVVIKQLAVYVHALGGGT